MWSRLLNIAKARHTISPLVALAVACESFTSFVPEYLTRSGVYECDISAGGGPGGQAAICWAERVCVE